MAGALTESQVKDIELQQSTLLSSMTNVAPSRFITMWSEFIPIFSNSFFITLRF